MVLGGPIALYITQGRPLPLVLLLSPRLFVIIIILPYTFSYPHQQKKDELF